MCSVGIYTPALWLWLALCVGTQSRQTRSMAQSALYHFHSALPYTL